MVSWAPRQGFYPGRAAPVGPAVVAPVQTSFSDIDSEFDDELELDSMVGDEDALDDAEPLTEEEEDEAGSDFENMEDESAEDDMEEDIEEDNFASTEDEENDDDEGYI